MKLSLIPNSSLSESWAFAISILIIAMCGLIIIGALFLLLLYTKSKRRHRRNSDMIQQGVSISIPTQSMQTELAYITDHDAFNIAKITPIAVIEEKENSLSINDNEAIAPIAISRMSTRQQIGEQVAANNSMMKQSISLMENYDDIGCMNMERIEDSPVLMRDDKEDSQSLDALNIVDTDTSHPTQNNMEQLQIYKRLTYLSPWNLGNVADERQSEIQSIREAPTPFMPDIPESVTMEEIETSLQRCTISDDDDNEEMVQQKRRDLMRLLQEKISSQNESCRDIDMHQIKEEFEES